MAEKETFSSCNLTFILKLDMVQVNQHAKYLGERSFD